MTSYYIIGLSKYSDLQVGPPMTVLADNIYASKLDPRYKGAYKRK